MSNLCGKDISLRDEFNGFNPYGGILEFYGKVRDDKLLDWLHQWMRSLNILIL